MARYPFTGSEPRYYSQYLQLDGEKGPCPLQAVPGGVYEIGIVPGWTIVKDGETFDLLSVPPADGLWGDPVNDTPPAMTVTSEGPRPVPVKERKGADA